MNSKVAFLIVVSCIAIGTVVVLNPPEPTTEEVKTYSWFDNVYKIKIVGNDWFEWKIEDVYTTKDPEVHGIVLVNHKNGRTVSFPLPDDLKPNGTLEIDTVALSPDWDGKAGAIRVFPSEK